MPDIYEVDEYSVPVSPGDYQNIIGWFTEWDAAHELIEKLNYDRISEFLKHNHWAISDQNLVSSLADIVCAYHGVHEKKNFISLWKQCVAITNHNLYGVSQSGEIFIPPMYVYTPISNPPDCEPDPESVEEPLWDQTVDDSGAIEPGGAFIYSPKASEIHSLLDPDRIFIFKGGAMLESELKVDTPCSYKSQGFSHCHNTECKLTVHYWTAGVPVLDVFKGESFEIDYENRTSWFLKHKNDIENLCKETSGGYHCSDCGTLSSSNLVKSIHKIINSKCINCYLNSIQKCHYCHKVISLLISGGAFNIDGIVHTICLECKSDLKQCSSCGKHFKTKPLFNGYCMSCAPSVIMDYNHKPIPIFHGDSNDSVYMGIELEVEMKEGLQQYSAIVANRFQEAAGSFVYLKKDSSISKEGFEIVTHPANLSFWKENSIFWNAIRKLTRTCEAWSVDNCGMHVHISRSAFNHDDHMAKFLLFINSNRLLSAFVAERYNAKQAPFMEMNFETAKNIATLNTKINRHCAVNVQGNIPTVEVRIFKGNLKKQRMLKNIEFVHSVFSFTKTETALEVEPYIEHVVTNKALYPNLCAYISKYKSKL